MTGEDVENSYIASPIKTYLLFAISNNIELPKPNLLFPFASSPFTLFPIKIWFILF